MFRNYLKVAIRNIVRHKSVSVINLFGLTTGLVCVLIISIWINNELSYDKFHSKHDRIYRLAYDEEYNGELLHWAFSWSSWSEGLKEQFSEVEEYTRLIRSSELVQIGQERFVVKNFLRADSSFFNVFDVEVVQGNKAYFLDNPYDIVITESAALKYFSSTKVQDKQLMIGEETYNISGVIKDWPEQSHFQFEILGSYDFHFTQNPEFSSEWIFTYLLLDERADLEAFIKKLPAFIDSQPKNNEFGEVSLLFQPLTDIHLHSARQGELGINSDIIYIYIFFSAAALILFITLLNFVNLTTAGSVYRIKEIGMRKVIGANRPQLVVQFIGESLLITIISITLALGVTGVLLAPINVYFGLSLSIDSLWNWEIMILLLSSVLFISTLVSLYPSVYLSRLQPKTIFKKESEHRSSKSFFRNAMVVAQFFICIVLLTSSYIIKDQFEYMLEKDPGYDIEQVIQIPLNNSFVKERFMEFKQRIIQHPSVLNVSAISNKPGIEMPWIGNFYPEGGGPDGDNYIVAHMLVEEDFLKTFGIKILKGRNFSNDMADSSYAYIINEAAAENLGWDKDPLGKQLTTFGSKKGQVIGVVENFHFEDFKQEIKPLILHIDRRYYNYATVKLKSTDYKETIAAIQEEWNKLETQWPMNYSFLRNDFENEYEADARMSSIIAIFSYISIIVGCMGLWGITLFTIKMKLKEIGIRKIFGASLLQVFVTLVKPVMKTVIVALILGLPLAYYLGVQWLNNFAYHVDLNPWHFLITSITILVLALITISLQSVQSTYYRPVDLLKDE